MIALVGRLERHGSPRLPWHTFLLLLFSGALYVVGGPAPEGWVFDRQAVIRGELWRLMTGHWVHGDTAHLAWNLAALAILGWLTERRLGPSGLYAALLAGMMAVSAGIWLCVPDLDLYCGFSGVLNTLLFVYLIDAWRKSNNAMFLLVMLGAAAKIGFELIQSSAIFTGTTWPAVPLAHLAGGAAAVMVMLFRRRRGDPATLPTPEPAGGQ